MSLTRARTSSLITIATMVAVLLVPVGSTAASAAEPEPVTITETVSEAGFTHPGIGVSADRLLNARDMVEEGAEPWASYYAAMAATKYASTTVRSSNAGADLDRPANPAFDSKGVQSKLIQDAFAAYTQAIMYVLTGDPVHRENGMRIIRIWSHMDPQRYAYYADAHIHSGVPLQRLLMAAELFRASSYDAEYAAYDLAWHGDDTANLTANLIEPMTATFLHMNNRYMNQHLYPLVGATAGYIFTDDRESYEEAVEWFTVNSTTDRPEQNGAIATLYPRIAADDPLNPYGYDFVQLQEMGRDQAHAWDDVSMTGVLARMLTVQGTTVDPVDGTASVDDDAVSPYDFLDQRILDGANSFVGYMLGHDVPWIDTTGGAGRISEAYRGRLFNPIDELYTVYRYDLGVDVEQEAPHLATLHEQADGPDHFWGTGRVSWWDPNPDYAPDYWLSLPPEAAEPRPVATDAAVQLETRSVPISGSSTVKSKDGTGFVRVEESGEDATIAVRTLLYPTRDGYSPVGVRVRTKGTATLEVRKSMELEPYRTVPLPDTRGEWATVTYDMDIAQLPGSTAGANLAYYTVTDHREGRVDLDHVVLNAKDEFDIPVFDAGERQSPIAVAGAEFTRSYPASAPGGTTVAYAADGLPSGAQVDAVAGELRWTPGGDQTGEHAVTVWAQAGAVVDALTLDVRVAASREDAVALALDGYDDAVAYTSSTRAEFEAVRQATADAVASASDAQFHEQLALLQTAVEGLRELTPHMGDDGSFDYRGLIANQSAVAVANLLDGDFTTTSGDLRAPYVLDFGSGYAVSAEAIGLQARFGFANRSEGANVYGSDDGLTWTLLTTRETTNTTDAGHAIETIPVVEELRGETWRYLKVQVDHPGIPTDPAYPGISSFSEIRIHGERHELAQAISAVSLSSSNADPGTAVNGDTVTLAVVGSEPLSEVSASIEGVPVDATSADGLTWTAEAVLPDDVGFGRDLVFSVGYVTADGRVGAALTATTDGSALALWNTHVSGIEVQREWVDASTPPWPGSTGTTQDNAWRMFDGDPATATDLTAGTGWVTIAPPEPVAVDLVTVTPRVSHPTRTNGTVLQGSDDGGATWHTVVTFSGFSGSAPITFALEQEASYALLRVLDEHGGNLNVAEVRLLHDDR